MLLGFACGALSRNTNAVEVRMRLNRRFAALFAIGAAVAVPIVGCGGSSNDNSTSNAATQASTTGGAAATGAGGGAVWRLPSRPRWG